MIGTAWAAGADGAQGGLFSDPGFWVAVAFVLFFALAGKVLWAKIRDMLDKRAGDISKALADAERLRAEALKAKQDAERTLAQASKQVRDTAVDVALAATRALLRDQVGQGRTSAMIDEAIAELPKRLH
jgi:F-type H+-transporting ATPase subunit b